MHLTGSSYQIKAIKFFGIFGIVLIIFGASLGLFDVMHSSVLSAIAALLALIIGGSCTMWAVGNFLQHIELDVE